MQELQPLEDRVIIRRGEPEQKKGLIIIPESAKEKSLAGEVLALGPKAKDKGVKVGDVVVFGKYAGHQLEVGGQDLVVMPFEDLFAVMGNRDVKPEKAKKA